MEEVVALGLRPGHAAGAVPVAPSDLVAMKEGDSPSKDLCHRDLRGPEAGRYPVQQLLKYSEMEDIVII